MSKNAAWGILATLFVFLAIVIGVTLFLGWRSGGKSSPSPPVVIMAATSRTSPPPERPSPPAAIASKRTADEMTVADWLAKEATEEDRRWFELGDRLGAAEAADALKLRGQARHRFYVQFGHLGDVSSAFSMTKAIQDVIEFGWQRAMEENKKFIRERGFLPFVAHLPVELPHPPSVIDKGPSPRPMGK